MLTEHWIQPGRSRTCLQVGRSTPRPPRSLTLSHPSVPQAQASLLCPPPALAPSSPVWIRSITAQIHHLPGGDQMRGEGGRGRGRGEGIV